MKKAKERREEKINIAKAFVEKHGECKWENIYVFYFFYYPLMSLLNLASALFLKKIIVNMIIKICMI